MVTRVDDLELLLIRDDEPHTVINLNDYFAGDEPVTDYGDLLDGITAAAPESYDGAMIALVPTPEDAKRLSVESGLSVDDLHLTLCYLGEAVKITPGVRDRLIEQLHVIARDVPVVDAEGFAVAAFNPTNPDKETCLVLLVSGSELVPVRDEVDIIARTAMGYNRYPEQHEPWIPHITLTYTDRTSDLPGLKSRTGHVRFNQLCLAIAGEKYEFPLYSDNGLTAHGTHNQEDHGNWADGDNVISGLGGKKRAVPAIIYKKHTDGTVVAESGDGKRRLRWNASTKKYVQESRDGDNNNWKKDKELTKTQAYEDLKKEDRWAEVGQSTASSSQSGSRSEKKKSDVSSQPLPKSDQPKKLKDNSAEISSLKKEIDELNEAAKKPAEIDMKIQQKANHAALTNSELNEQTNAWAQLKELVTEGRGLAEQQLELLIEQDGAPWGSIDVDADKWKNAANAVPHHKISTVYLPNVDHNAMQKIRDSYVVNDKQTIMHNTSLRSPEPSTAAKGWRGRVRKLVNSQKFIENSIVYRGAALRPETIMSLRPGVTLRDKGIMSTDEDIKTARFYTGVRQERLPGTIETLFEIRVPKGHAGANVGYGEFVFADETPLKVVSSERLPSGEVYVIMEME
jgi:2'-5' RNA ligase